MNRVEAFVDQLVQEKAVTADPTVMQEYRADLLLRVGERLNAEMVALLPAEQVAELNDLLDVDPEPEVLQEFFATYIPKYQDVFAQTLADFRASYMK
jgi:hypothetical protein